MKRTIALVGGRGYTGSELLKLIAAHPGLSLAFASSGSRAGEPIRTSCPEWPGDDEFCALQPGSVATRKADAWVLAVPNGAAAAWAEIIGEAHPNSVILDLSADFRFDACWTYGLPERFREDLRTARRIANPGCYATGIQLALLPVLDRLEGTPVAFGVSGYSGAGRTPSERNDPERLRDNILPYRLNGHVHEREVSAQLGCDVRFVPHVASFFRGISLTVCARLAAPASADWLAEEFAGRYRGEPFVKVARDIPEVAAVRGTPEAHIGGFSVDERDPRRITVVATLDNLSKGAASQAMQNLNLALGLDEWLGLTGGHADD